MKLNYEKDASIDINALDIEWLNHPKKEEKYIALVADLKKEVTNCIEQVKVYEEKVKTIRSMLIQKVHNDPENCIGKGKATGPEAEAYYRNHRKYKKIKDKLIKAQVAEIQSNDAFNTAKDMKDLLHFTKTKSLENLVVLHGQGYFAGPKVPRNIKREIERYEEKEERVKERRKKQGKKLKRKRS